LRIAPFGRDKVGLIYYLQIDCDLDLRVYTEEPEDEAGTSWALRARNETELIDLINSLKRPDFGKKSSEDQPDDDAEEMDEEQLLDSPKSIVKKASISSNISNHVNDTKEKTSTDIKQFKLDEAQRAKIIMQTKSEILWDCYRKQDLLNKRKLERDKQKKDHVSHTIVVEDVEIPSTSRNIVTDKEDIKNELNLGDNKEFDTPEQAISNGRASRIAALQRASIALGAANRKKLSAFAIDESSDDEDAEPDEEEKERKRATELSLCQHCKGVNRPDLLLLCDNCDDAWHTFCLRPQLWYVPDGNWFCPPCEHNSLINRLIYALLMLRDNKKIQDQQKKKEAAADRLKREMDFIGISLNNIIPSGIKKDDGHVNTSSTEDSDESGDGQYLQRKSKKRAMKIVTSKSRLQRRAMEQIEHLCPIVTVAEGRSRRAMKRVDYNFRSYDEQLQEAMHSIDPDAKLNDSEMSESEAGRGKDIQNTYIAGEQQKDIRDKSDDNEEESDVPARKRDAPARPPKGRVPKVNNKTVKKNKRLTDLDVDDVTESDTDEWHESSADNVEEDPEPSEDEYLPSERTRTNKGMWSRHKSDDEFINDDSDPDYVDKSRRRAGGKKKNRTETKSKNKRRNTETSTSDDDNDIQPSASDSDAPASNRTKNKRQKLNISSSDEEAKRLHKTTEAGRPLRRAAAKVGARLIEVDDEWENEDEEDDYVAEHETNTEDNKTGDRSDKNASVDKPILSGPSTSALENKIDLSSNDNDESSSKSSGDDGEENFSNKTSNVQRVQPSNVQPSPIMKVKKKLPPPRKASKSKKRAPAKIKKATRGRGRKQTTKLENSDCKPGFEKIDNSMQRKRSTSLAKESVVKVETNSKQQKIQELPIVSSNDNANIQKQQKSLPPQPRKIEIPLALTISEPSKEQKPEVTIPVKTLSNETVTVENEKSLKKNAPINLNINEQTIEKPPSNVEMSIKLKLEAFVKEKIQPKIEKTMPQVVSTSSRSAVSSSIAVQPPTLAPATRIVLQQRPMAHSTSFASFQNNTPPNVSGPQVAIMPTVLPPPMTVGLPQGCVPQFVPQPPATYFMQQGAPPQIIYQTLQPYGSVLPPHAAFPGHPMQVQQSHQAGGIVDQESLSHALAGAMNPEDL
uniref:PHD-type domain-containing protein n=1 Tax=Meloidogyne javanica TaxID=6303 RepID=A0A915M559_MELJA